MSQPTIAVSHYSMHLGGEWVESLSGERDSIINPATGAAIATVPRGTSADADKAVEAAKKALPDWLDTTPAERSYLLHAIADVVQKNVETLARIESENTGKPLLQAMWQIGGYFADTIRFMAGAARNLEGLSAGEYIRGYTSYVRREPVGITVGITPWNYPMPMAGWKFATAIAAGNVHILKPSELTPLSVLKFAELIEGILPPGVFQILTADGVAGSRLVEHPDVNFVSVTGSVETGRKVAAAAGTGLKRSHLELGGNAPVLIFDDADLEYARDALKISSYFNSGQDCEASTRFLAAPSLYDATVSLMVDAAKSLRIGNPADSLDLDLGPLISKKQQGRVLGFLNRAEDRGAEILTGGETMTDEGAFVTPAVVVGVNQKDEIVQSEVFGPVITVQQFESDDQAIAWANDSSRRLAANVFTENHGRAMDATRRLNFGKVWVNDTFVGPSEFPHGGFGESGYGKDGSMYGFEEYTQIKSVTHRGARERSFWSNEMHSDLAALRASLQNPQSDSVPLQSESHHG